MNALVSEANTIASEMQQQTTYSVMLQIPVSYLKPSQRVRRIEETIFFNLLKRFTGYNEFMRVSCTSEKTKFVPTNMECRKIRIKIK